MRVHFSSGRWARPLAALVIGAVLFGFSAANGHGLELIWLPAGLLAAAWPVDRKRALTDCRRRAHGQRQKDA